MTEALKDIPANPNPIENGASDPSQKKARKVPCGGR